MEGPKSQKTMGAMSGRSFLSRRLPKSHSGSDMAADLKGPLGLNTLYQPQSFAVVDLVFVHGLGGGSRSTWTKSDDPSLYWIQEWLPNDPGFKDVRIHSFGYNSDWSKESVLNLHDFAKSLLGSIEDCPSIPRSSNVPLIFVGHSMGGLVIKRAFILAKQKDEFQSLAARVRTIFFLATPHRGADLAQTLSKILNVSSGPRPFVEDLHRNSVATQSINDEFPQHCQDLQLYSFYETLPTSLGIGKSLVVDKDLATLGYANERTAYLSANHREVCKFNSSADPNYQTIRNAMASAIDSFRDRMALSKHNFTQEQYRLLDSFLGFSDAPENDFMDAESLRMPGSCEWILNRQNFLEWRDSMNSQIYWISAKPATGKTVLSGKIIHHLKDLYRDLAFYFFDYRNKAKTTISSFLLSMAWQMARMHTEVLEIVLVMCQQDDELRKADYRTIWRRLFVEGILRIPFVRPQYWVIDALDECKNDSEIVPLLLKAVEVCPIRILSTSRYSFQSYRHAIHQRVQVVSEEISVEDVKWDIKLYLEANMDQLPKIDQETQQDMISKIITKSAGCFLWVSLIVQELRRVHTSAEIRQVLEDVPSDMDELYLRILDSMSSAPYGKNLAKAILTWTVCAARPLSTQELYHALRIDMRDNIDSVERSIASSCGQLIYVDAQSQVRMIHQTARDFLLKVDTNTSEFGIEARKGHKRLVMACLQYLNSNEMKGPRHRRLSAINISHERCPFVTYACNAFFEHITYVSSVDDDFLVAMAKFLNSSNVLSWVEYIAQQSNLNKLIQAGKALRYLLQRRSKHLSPFGKEVAILESWANDLVRLVTKFGRNLSASPTSIFHLIPPFCPTETALHRQFAFSTRGIAVIGLSATSWDDCLSVITAMNAQEHFSALACSDKYFAIGMSTGKVLIHSEMTCQELHSLQHHESVRKLEFSKSMNVLASAGAKIIRVWDIASWEQVSEFDIAHQSLAIAFVQEQQLLLAALRDNHLMIWDLATGTLRDSANWTLELEGPNAHAFRRPIAAAICTESYLLAVVYRGQDILLWDLERDKLHETYCKETGARAHDQRRHTTAGATGLIFSLAPNLSLLAASYSDGDLVVFDTSEGNVCATTEANAQTLACSPDGRTLATGNASGTLQLYDFETLKLLYRINSGDYGIKQLAFSGEGHRLVDIGGSQCHVWDPPVLVREDIDENSDSVSISTTAQEGNIDSSDDIVLITSLVCSKEDRFFCGKEDGSVYSYDVKAGQQKRELFSHADGVSILSLNLYDEVHLIVSIDTSSRIMVHQLTLMEHDWIASNVLFDHRVGTAVNQVLINSDSTRLLVSTGAAHTLWSTSIDETSIVQTLPWQDRVPYRWETHPRRQEQLILIADNTVHLYEWKTLHKLTSDDGGILLEGSILPELSIQSIIPCFGGSVIGTTFSRPSSSSSESSKLLLWDTSDLKVNSKSAVPIPKYRSLADQVKKVIGEYGQRLVFLHSSSWICSVNLQSPSGEHITRHFFLPADWLSTNMELMFGVTHNGEIIFVKRNEVAVIKRGLEADDKGRNLSSTRPSLLRGKMASLEVPEVHETPGR